MSFEIVVRPFLGKPGSVVAKVARRPGPDPAYRPPVLEFGRGLELFWDSTERPDLLYRIPAGPVRVAVRPAYVSLRHFELFPPSWHFDHASPTVPVAADGRGAFQILRRGKRQALPPLAVSWWIEPTGADPAQPGDFALMVWPSGDVVLTEDRPAIIRFFHLHPEATPGRTFRLRIAQQDAPANTGLDPVQDAIPWIIA